MASILVGGAAALSLPVGRDAFYLAPIGFIVAVMLRVGLTPVGALPAGRRTKALLLAAPLVAVPLQGVLLPVGALVSWCPPRDGSSQRKSTDSLANQPLGGRPCASDSDDLTTFGCDSCQWLPVSGW